MRLVEWVWEYYSREQVRQPGGGPQTPKLQSSPVFVSGRPPLYFQHQVRRRPYVIVAVMLPRRRP